MITLFDGSKLIDSNLFKAFLAAAETGNFTHAATLAHMTQPGVSQHIARLEEEIGHPLFHRLKRHVELTAAGKILARYIENHIHSTNAFWQDLHNEYDELSGPVRFVVPAPFLFPILDKLSRIDPTDASIDYRIKTFFGQDLRRLLFQRQIDFGISREKIEDPQINSHLICQDELLLVGTSAELLNRCDSEEGLEQNFIRYPESDGFYEAWLESRFPGVREEGRPALPSCGSIDSVSGALSLVLAGHGLGIFPRSYIQRYVSHNELYACCTEPILRQNLYLAMPADQDYPKRVQRVIDLLLEGDSI